MHRPIEHDVETCDCVDCWLVREDRKLEQNLTPSQPAPAAKPKWRQGNKLGRTIYRDDVCVGMVDTADIARSIVEKMNESL